MTRLLVILLAVGCVGCGIADQRQHQADRQARLDSLLAYSDSCNVAALATLLHAQEIVLGALERADGSRVDSMPDLQRRIDRLAADSARCAASKPDTCQWVYSKDKWDGPWDSIWTCDTSGGGAINVPRRIP